MNNNNNKNKEYTFRFTESELIKIKETLDIAVNSMDVEVDTSDLIQLNNIFSLRLQKIKKKKIKEHNDKMWVIGNTYL